MDSCVVPHRSTNRAVLWLTAQIGRDAVLSESYGRRHLSGPKVGSHAWQGKKTEFRRPTPPPHRDPCMCGVNATVVCAREAMTSLSRGAK